MFVSRWLTTHWLDDLVAARAAQHPGEPTGRLRRLVVLVASVGVVCLCLGVLELESVPLSPGREVGLVVSLNHARADETNTRLELVPARHPVRTIKKLADECLRG